LCHVGRDRASNMSKVVWRFFRSQRKGEREGSELKPLDPTTDHEAMEQQVTALLSAWNRASLRARRTFLKRIDQRILSAHRTKEDPAELG
jgi:hypothetical protein